MRSVSHVPDRLAVSFDDEGLVANAGLLVVATLAARLGIGRLVERDRAHGRPGRRGPSGPQGA